MHTPIRPGTNMHARTHTKTIYNTRLNVALYPSLAPHTPPPPHRHTLADDTHTSPCTSITRVSNPLSHATPRRPSLFHTPPPPHTRPSILLLTRSSPHTLASSHLCFLSQHNTGLEPTHHSTYHPLWAPTLPLPPTSRSLGHFPITSPAHLFIVTRRHSSLPGRPSRRADLLDRSTRLHGGH